LSGAFKYEDELSEIERDIAEKKEVVARVPGKEQRRAVGKRCIAQRYYRLQDFCKLHSGEHGGVKETLERLVNEKTVL